MTKLQQRLAALITLAIVSAVSLLAGGIVLGGASADDGDSDPATPIGYKGGVGVGVNVQVNHDKNGETSCVIAFDDGDPNGEVPEFKFSDRPPLPEGGVQDIRVFKAEGRSAGGEPFSIRSINPDEIEKLKAEAPVFTRAVEAMPISPEDIEKLKADGALEEIDPSQCTIVNPEKMPEGWTPGKILEGGPTLDIVTAKP